MSAALDWLVIGAGFRGIVAAHLLARAGARVALADAAREPGGVLRSTPWRGHALDFGCHLFGNESEETTALLLDLLDGDVVPVPLRVASATNGTVRHGTELPDLGAWGRGTAAAIVLELLEVARAPGGEPASLADWLAQRYGPTAAGLLGPMAAKLLATDPALLDAAAAASTPFRRVRVVDAPQAELLKAHPLLDDRVAADTPDDPMRYYRPAARHFPHRAFYPRQGGMGAFSAAAARRLGAAGVTLALGAPLVRLALDGDGVTLVRDDAAPLRASRALWAADLPLLATLLGVAMPAPAVHAVPMVLVYFDVDADAVGEVRYAHDFDATTPVFRASAPGSFGAGPTPDGRSYVCCELPCTVASDPWRDPEGCVPAAWAAAVRLGVARGDRWHAHLARPVPASYRVPTRAAAALERALEARLAAAPRLHRTDAWAFSKRAMVADVRRVLDRAA